MEQETVSFEKTFKHSPKASKHNFYIVFKCLLRNYTSATPIKNSGEHAPLVEAANALMRLKG